MQTSAGQLLLYRRWRLLRIWQNPKEKMVLPNVSNLKPVTNQNVHPIDLPFSGH